MANREIEFIRYLLDYIDNKIEKELKKQSTDKCEVTVISDESPETDEVTSPIDDDTRFIPPLQANIEMMKKLSGVPPKDETLSQSQKQGGPVGNIPPIGSSDIARVLGVIDGNMFSQ
jgi:hypothetical protein